MNKLKALWKKQWFKNLVFFSFLAVAFFTDFPLWVRVQFTQMGLEAPSKLEQVNSDQESVYTYDLRVEDVNGQTMSWKSLEGKPVFVNFWASWCVPCLAEFSSLSKLHQAIPEMEMMVVNLEDRPTFKKYMDDTPHDLPFYRQVTPLPPKVNPSAVPASFILDREGKVIYRFIGAANWESEAAVDRVKKALP